MLQNNKHAVPWKLFRRNGIFLFSRLFVNLHPGQNVLQHFRIIQIAALGEQLLHLEIQLCRPDFLLISRLSFQQISFISIPSRPFTLEGS